MHNMMTGSIVALITPFHEDGSVNYEKVAELAEYTGEYIRDAAYEAYLLLQEEQKKQEIEDKRRELQSQIGKMF